MKNYSRQREAVLQALRSTDAHPTAQWVYEQVRTQFPRISLGTVYRNLALLRAEGAVSSLTVGDGFEHFDVNCSPHVHLHCKKCGRIADAPLNADSPREAALQAGFAPESEVYVLCGICRECREIGND